MVRETVKVQLQGQRVKLKLFSTYKTNCVQVDIKTKRQTAIHLLVQCILLELFFEKIIRIQASVPHAGEYYTQDTI